MDHRALRDELTGAASRIERRKRILEDHLDTPRLVAHLTVRQRCKVNAVETDRAFIGIEQADDAARKGRFSGSAFANDSKRPATRQEQVRIAHRMRDAPTTGKQTAAPISLGNVFDPQDRVAAAQCLRRGRGKRRNRGDQGVRVGMTWIIEDLVGRSLLPPRGHAA